VWYVVEKTSINIAMSILVLVLASGCGQPSGNAPGAAPSPDPIDPPSSSYSAVMKYGQTVTTTSGWTVSIDNSDPVVNSSLANGWTVEVLNE
jgi:hypothetical protein